MRFICPSRAVLFALLSRLASKLLGPSKPTTAKLAPYECGIVPSREPPERFPVRFYLLAMLFIIFDIEIVFLYPYAVFHRQLGPFGFWSMIEFSAVFFIAFVYMVASGALDWGPLRKVRRLDVTIPSGRTTESTIRRVGLEGRETEGSAA